MLEARPDMAFSAELRADIDRTDFADRWLYFL
jgi:hypothetical protein